MSAITKIKTLELVQPTTPANPIWKLAKQVTDTATELIMNFEPLDKDWAAITQDFLIWVQTSTWYTETMLVTTVSWTTLTVVRWIDLGWLDFAWDAALAVEHSAWEVSVFNIPATTLQMIFSALKWEISTAWEVFKIWNEADNDILIKASNWDANSPFFKYIAADSKWVFSNDWVAELDLATWGVSTAWDWIDITASTISIDLDTDAGLEFDSWKLQIKLNWTKLVRDSSWLTVNEAEFDTNAMDQADETDFWVSKKATDGDVISWVEETKFVVSKQVNDNYAWTLTDWDTATFTAQATEAWTITIDLGKTFRTVRFALALTSYDSWWPNYWGVWTYATFECSTTPSTLNYTREYYDTVTSSWSAFTLAGVSTLILTDIAKLTSLSHTAAWSNVLAITWVYRDWTELKIQYSIDSDNQSGYFQKYEIGNVTIID